MTSKAKKPTHNEPPSLLESLHATNRRLKQRLVAERKKAKEAASISTKYRYFVEQLLSDCEAKDAERWNIADVRAVLDEFLAKVPSTYRYRHYFDGRSSAGVSGGVLKRPSPAYEPDDPLLLALRRQGQFL